MKKNFKIWPFLGKRAYKGIKVMKFARIPPHTYYENCPQFSKLSGVIQQLFYFFIYNFSKHFPKYIQKVGHHPHTWVVERGKK